MIKFWTAVSWFETAGWTSNVLKQSNNLFCIIVPGSTRLNFGEGQTIYPDFESSVDGLIDHVIKPFKYPSEVFTIDELVAFMKKKGYFKGSETAYLAGVKKYL